MNKNLVKRWLNEYLDGEIGLADKADLERRMAEDPKLAEEYKSIRRLGLLLGSQREVEVHPTRFRAKLADALDAGHRPFLTPQRAFAAAMVVALLVVGINMSLMVYQQHYLGQGGNLGGSTEAASVAPANQAPALVLDTGVDAQRFFSRLMLSYQLGLVDAETMQPVLSQTRVFEGVTCAPKDGSSMYNLNFQSPLNQSMKLRTSSQTIRNLSLLALELSGRQPSLVVRLDEGKSMPLDEFAKQYGADRRLELVLLFEPAK